MEAVLAKLKASLAKNSGSTSEKMTGSLFFAFPRCMNPLLDDGDGDGEGPSQDAIAEALTKLLIDQRFPDRSAMMIFLKDAIDMSPTYYYKNKRTLSNSNPRCSAPVQSGLDPYPFPETAFKNKRCRVYKSLREALAQMQPEERNRYKVKNGHVAEHFHVLLADGDIGGLQVQGLEGAKLFGSSFCCRLSWSCGCACFRARQQGRQRRCGKN